MTNEQTITKMLEDITFRNLSSNTKDKYIMSVKIFMKYYNMPVENLNEEHIRKFLKHLIEERKVTNQTANIYNYALRFMYLVTLEKDLKLKQIPVFKCAKKLPELLTKEELVKLLNSADNLKHRAILMTIYGAGLRISEATNIRIKDIDSENMRILVRDGKGQKDRYTILSKSNLEILREYFKQYRPNHVDGYLFLSKMTSGRLTNAGVQHIFKNCKNKCKIQKSVTVHTLRHLFATHLLENGIDILQIKELLGHAAIKSTVNYLHIANFDSNLKSPLDILMEEGASNA